MKQVRRTHWAVVCAILVGFAAQAAVAPELRDALQRITTGNLKADLSFLASDALQGRYTPSPGLEVAAEFIAAQFRGAGLKPGGDEDYFQMANMVDRKMPAMQSGITLHDSSRRLEIPAQAITVTDTSGATNIDGAAVVVFKTKDSGALKGVELAGKAVIAPGFKAGERDFNVYRKARAFDEAVSRGGAVLEVSVTGARGMVAIPRLMESDQAKDRHMPALAVTSDELQNWIDHADEKSEARTISVEVPAPEDKNVAVKNVIGVLPGSDPKLKNTYVMLTAHYDHIGTLDTAGRSGQNQRPVGNDRIFNGANDDGSGTVSVIEIARAMASMPNRPKRSMIFMTFFGEERGELGSSFYGRHPRFPVSETVADLNLEQVGRTDSTEGPQVNTASLTGYDYSDVTKYMEQAGQELGIKVYLDKSASDPYFTRSDNASLAELGVPAHSLTVAFDYPDYHGLGDEWQKIDYDNLARVDRMILLGLFNIANSTKPPAWNAQNPKTLPFREAQQKLHAGTNP